MRSNAAAATSRLCSSFLSVSGETGSEFQPVCADFVFAFASFPTTSTSIGEIEGNKSARFSAGKTESAWRITSNRHVSESATKNILRTTNESAGVHGRKLYWSI